MCVYMSYQRIVLCYQNEAIVVNEVAVDVLLKKSVKGVVQNTVTELWRLECEQEDGLTSSSQLMEHFPSNAAHCENKSINTLNQDVT